VGRVPDISFVVSCYDRPKSLFTCLASLADQTSDWNEIIVTDNSIDPAIQSRHMDACSQFGATYIPTRVVGCYHSAEIGAQSAQAEWLSFPSDDSYFCPKFAEEMLATAKATGANLVFSEMVYNGRWSGEPYHLMDTAPCLNRIDKTGFLVKRDKFPGFPDKGNGESCAADGLLIDRLVREGIKWAKCNSILAVHN